MLEDLKARANALWAGKQYIHVTVTCEKHVSASKANKVAKEWQSDAKAARTT